MGRARSGRNMIILFTQIILFAAAAALGFGLGAWLFSWIEADRRRGEVRDVERLRQALSDAQVRRARLS